MRTIAGICALVLLCAGTAMAQERAAPPKLADAGPNDIRVYAINSIATPLRASQAGMDAAAGKHVVIEYGAARSVMKEAILGGAPFELALLMPDVNDELAKAGKTVKAVKIGEVPMAFTLKGEPTAALDVSTPDATRKTLLGAKAIRFGVASSGLPISNKILSDLGIADKVNHVDSAAPPTVLGASEYEIALSPLSEVIPNKNVKNLGSFPDSYGKVIVVAAIGSQARDRASVDKLIAYLTGPDMAPALTADGWKK